MGTESGFSKHLDLQWNTEPLDLFIKRPDQSDYIFLRRIVPVAICGTEQATEMKQEHVGRLTAMWAEGQETPGQSEDVELAGRRSTADECLDETKCVPLFLEHRVAPRPLFLSSLNSLAL